ncbi:MAG: hypothetical protein KIT17_25260 [Rubrivivax sp.]|nr:hypothetical protein [Rubrivivax sp.]
MARGEVREARPAGLMEGLRALLGRPGATGPWAGSSRAGRPARVANLARLVHLAHVARRRLAAGAAAATTAATAAMAALALAWPAPAAPAERVAVAVYADDPSLRRYERAVQARLEEILADSGFEPLDEAKAKALRDNWVELANPGHLITAEEIVAQAGRYDVKRIFRAGFTAGQTQPLGLYHSATAQVQLRVIDGQARVKASASVPMGTRGFAGSDATTADAALVNALQRAVDSVAEAASLKVLAPASARSLALVLEPIAQPPAGAEAVPWPAAASPPAGWEKSARLLEERWRNESVRCTTTSPDGGMGVVGTLAQHIDRFGGGVGTPSRNYGGYAHVVDLKEPRELVRLALHEVGPRASGESGTSAVIACGFLGAWRHLVVASGNRIACIDVERGRETCSLPLPGAPEKAALQLWQAGGERFVELRPEKGASSFFRVVVGR